MIMALNAEGREKDAVIIRVYSTDVSKCRIYKDDIGELGHTNYWENDN